MNIRYKFVTVGMRSKNGDRAWSVGEWRSVTPPLRMCSNGYHVYRTPLLAVLHNPIHCEYGPDARLFECECDGDSIQDDQMKECWQRVRLVREIATPVVTREQIVRYAIMCAKSVFHDAKWDAWADRWLSGQDRTAYAAHAAADLAADSAAYAAYAAAYVAAYAAYAAAYAAYAAAYAAYAAEKTSASLDLSALAEQAVESAREEGAK